MSKRYAFTVEGVVQGVCFRDFTEKKANSYGLTGWVRNTQNGSVQVEAQGQQQAIEKLKQDLKEGPRSAKVTKVNSREIDTKSGEKNFFVAS